MTGQPTDVTETDNELEDEPDDPFLKVENGLEKRNNDTRKHGPSWQFWRQKRYIVSILSFFGFSCGYALRANFSVAIVDMTQLKNVTLENGTAILKNEFDWDSKLQGYVLSSFYYGYIFTQIIGGYLATKFGGARIFGAGIASTAILTIITPWVAKTNVYLLMALRILEGLCEGVTYPAGIHIWASWAPPLEKSRLVSIAVSGAYVGNVVAMPVSSLLATAYGWETIFYFFGALGLIWYLIWSLVVRNFPSEDSKISSSELKYITESINDVTPDELSIVPWSSLLRSGAVWAIAITLSCETWGWYTMITFLPKMLKSLLDFDLNKSGFISAVPYIAMALSVQIGGQLADWLITKKYLTTTQTRRLSIFVGFVSQGAFLLSAAFWISPIATPVFLTMGTAFGGFALSGIMVNSLDVAPKFASVIYGISNTVGTLPGIVSPIVTGYIVRDPTNASQWRIVYYISAGMYFLGAILSTIFISGEMQPWATVRPKHEKEEKKDITKIDALP